MRGSSARAGRPIPSGAVSVPAAWVFAIVLSCCSDFAILLAFNRFAILLGVGSLFLVAAYPFMKRITWWPQAWLGLTFNWGVLFGYAAMTGTLGARRAAVLRGLLLLDDRLRHIYAHQDKEDDVLIGVKSAAIRLGRKQQALALCLLCRAFALMLAGGLAAGLRIVFAAPMLVAGAHLLVAVAHARYRPAAALSCMLFKSNRDTGALIAAALILGSVTGV